MTFPISLGVFTALGVPSASLSIMREKITHFPEYKYHSDYIFPFWTDHAAESLWKYSAVMLQLFEQ